MTNLAHFPSQSLVPPIRFRSIDAYLSQEFPVRHHLISEGILPVGGKLLVGGQKGVGKTIIMTQIACELASASPCLGLFNIPEPKRALVIQKEVIDDELQDRLRITVNQYPGLHPDMLLIPNREDVRDIMLDTWQGIKILDQCIDYYEPDVVFLDPIMWFHNIDEDKATEVKKILEPLNNLTVKYKCAFVISHHFKKQVMDFKGKHLDQGLQDFRGSGVWGGWCDTALWANDRGNDRLMLGSFLRNGSEQLPSVVLTLNRKQVRFEGQIQDEPTSTAEYAIAQILAMKPGYQCSYTDLESALKQKKIGPRQANTAISTMKSKNMVYFIGNNSHRVVRLLSPQMRMWV